MIKLKIFTGALLVRDCEEINFRLSRWINSSSQGRKNEVEESYVEFFLTQYWRIYTRARKSFSAGKALTCSVYTADRTIKPEQFFFREYRQAQFKIYLWTVPKPYDCGLWCRLGVFFPCGRDFRPRVTVVW